MNAIAIILIAIAGYAIAALIITILSALISTGVAQIVLCIAIAYAINKKYGANVRLKLNEMNQTRKARKQDKKTKAVKTA